MTAQAEEHKADRDKKLALQKQLGEYVRSLRKKKGMSAALLASLCETPRSSMTRLEKGGINPSFYFLTKLCEGLEISTGEFFKGFEIHSDYKSPLSANE